MKSLFGFLIAFGLLAGFSSPVFAEGCEDLAAQVEEKIAGANLSEEKEDQVIQLLEEGKTLCESGEEEKAVALMNQAMEMIGN